MTLDAEMAYFIENYNINTDGTITRKNNDKVLKPLKGGGSYRVSLCRDGKIKRYSVSRLVASVHIPNPKNKPIVIHLDGDKCNNEVTNLKWATYSESERYFFFAHNKQAAHGNDHYMAILNEDSVRDIRDSKLDVQHLAEMYGVHRQTINDVLSRRTWNHVI